MTDKNNDFKYISKPLLKFIVIIVSLVAFTSFGLNKINSMKDSSAQVSAENIRLNTKLSVLSSIAQTFSGDINFLNLALPVKSSVLFGISQLRSIALTNNLIISNIRSSSPVSMDSNISKVTLVFDLEGSEPDLFTFLERISKSLPIMNYNKVKLSTIEGLMKANVSVDIYYSQLPKTIPSLTTSVTQLNSNEIKLFEELGSYTLPTFESPTVKEFPDKTSPF